MSAARRAGTVARRYARALFAAARDASALDQVRADCSLLEAVLADPGALAMLSDPRFDAKAKRTLLEKSFGEMLHALTRSLLGVLERRRRVALLTEIPLAFRELDDAHAGRVRGEVETAQPLDDVARARLEGALSARTGRTVHLITRTDPALLGGARVTFGGTRLDASVRGALDALQRRLLEADLR